MARGDGIHRTNARNMRLTAAKIGNAQQHNEREKESYVNQDIVPELSLIHIYPHDITMQQLSALGNVRALILNGGPNRMLGGTAVAPLPEVLACGLQMCIRDRAASAAAWACWRPTSTA